MPASLDKRMKRGCWYKCVCRVYGSCLPYSRVHVKVPWRLSQAARHPRSQAAFLTDGKCPSIFICLVPQSHHLHFDFISCTHPSVRAVTVSATPAWRHLQKERALLRTCTPSSPTSSSASLATRMPTRYTVTVVTPGTSLRPGIRLHHRTLEANFQAQA